MNDNSPFRCPECSRLMKDCICDEDRFERDEIEFNPCLVCNGNGCRACNNTGMAFDHEDN